MKKLKLNLEGKEMLTKEQLKTITGGYFYSEIPFKCCDKQTWPWGYCGSCHNAGACGEEYGVLVYCA